MQEKLMSLDIKILETFATHGPRNLSKVARIAGIPRQTLQDWTRRMSSSPHFYLRFFASIYHTDIGLKKGVAFVETNPGYESTLLNCLKVNGFWIYLSRCYGMFDGYIGVYTIPKGHEEKFERFLEEIKRLGVARNVRLFWSTCFQGVNRRSNWFDDQLGMWVVRWDRWIEEIPFEGTELPRSVVESDSYPVKADKIDILILKELEKDATISFKKLAGIVGLTTPAVWHRYRKLLKRGLIDGFEIFVYPYDPKVSEMSFFIFNFNSYEKMAKLANSLLDKPFVFIVGKIFGCNALVSQIYLPTAELTRFRVTLSKLIKKGFLQTYIYAIQGEPRFRQTISYEFFEDHSWIYDHERHMEDLQEVAGKVLLRTAGSQTSS